MKKASHTQHGFTLIELLVVISIISVLSSAVLATISGVRASARDTKRLQQMRQIQKALETYKTRFGQYPQTPNGAQESRGCGPDGFKKGLEPLVNEGLMTSIPCDPQTESRSKFRTYHYFAPGEAMWNDPTYCGTTNVDEFQYFLRFTPEDEMDLVPWSGSPSSSNTCGPGTDTSWVDACCIHP